MLEIVVPVDYLVDYGFQIVACAALRLHKAPIEAQCANQGYFHSSRVKIGQFNDATKIVSRCPTFAEGLSFPASSAFASKHGRNILG